MIHLLVADDHPLFREGVKRVLSKPTGIAVSGEAATGREVLEKIRETTYDAVLLDLSLPDRNGLDLLKEIRRETPRLPVLILAVSAETQDVLRAFRAGAAGYLTKDSPPEELLHAVRTIAEGRKYVHPSLAEKLALALERSQQELLHEILSDREFQIMCLIASGKTLTEIAGELRLSIKTISTYRSRLLKKMNMQNNADLTRYALQNRLIY